MLYIALILSLATSTGLALLAAKRGRDYNKILEKYISMSKSFYRLQHDVYVLREDYLDSLKSIKQMQEILKRYKQSGIKAGIIQQSSAENLFETRNVCK